MEAHTSTTLEALERTAAWVQQCQVQVEHMKNSQENKTMETSGEEMRIVEEDIKAEPSDKDDNSLTDHHDEALKMAQAFPPYVPKGKNGANNYSHIDVHATCKEFKEALEKFGISQRFACIHIMENTSQGNLSFLLDKGKNKRWSEISPRGRIPYIRMRQWLDSPREQQATLGLLSKSKDYRKCQRGGVGDMLMNKREKFSVFQLLVLCRVFEEDANPSLSTRALLADKLEAPLERITIWFQNQRARGFPAAKLLRESNLGKDSIKLLNLTPKKDQGMRKSDTPLSNGNTSASNSVPLDYSKISTTPQSNEASTSTGQKPVSTVTQPASYSQLQQLPLPLMNMPMTSEPMTLSSTLKKGQTFASYPHLYTSTQSKNNTAVNDAINFLTMYPQVTVKQEPQDPAYESLQTSTS